MAMALRRGVGGSLAGGRGGGGGPQRLAVAVGVTAVAAGIGVARRASRGPTRVAPPVAEKRPHAVPFGDPVARTNMDDYFWLRDDKRERPEVMEHLKAENAYTNYMTLPLRRRADVLYKEMLSHTQETDMAVPTPRGPWEYYVRTVKGSSYVFHCRRAVGADEVKGDEQVLLDENELAKGKKYCDVATVEMSPNHRLMAVAVDYIGDEKYRIDFYDIASGKKLEGASISETNRFVNWGRDNDTVFYGTMDEAQRSNKVWKHDMSGGNGDVCLFTENDEVLSVYFRKTLSDRFLFIVSASSTTSEYRYIDLEMPGYDVHLVAERKDDILYSVEHAGGDRFLITTNADGATNFKVLEGRVGADPSTWTEFIAYKPERTVLGLTSFETFTVVSGREGGFAKLWIMEDSNPGKMYELEVDEESSVVSLGANMEFKADKFRFLYSSMTTPEQTYDYEIASRKRMLLKETPVPEYDRSFYKTERLEVVAEDGAKIPMSLVWNEKAVNQDAPNLLHLYGYASYGISVDPSFYSYDLPLLDRGVVYAIAHCRGGGEGGRSWYEAARFETKPKSFSDFVSCAELLVSTGRTTPAQLSMGGDSAGGLLIGAVMNLRPELFRAVIAGVPVVDVLNTMSDKTIPLTTQDTQDLGDPNDCGKYFDVITSYCPYQNVALKPYPAVLVTAGLHDPRVLYSEPTKWVAKLREHTTSDREILLKIDLDSGHASISDRYKFKRERAFELAWLLNQLGAPIGKLSG